MGLTWPKRFPLVLVGLLAMVLFGALQAPHAQPTSPTATPSALQSQGIRAIEAYRTKVRVSGERDNALLRRELDALRASVTGFTSAGQPADAAASEIQLGNGHRLLNEPETSWQHYAHALELATKAGARALRARALRGLAVIEIESRRQFETARARVEEGLALAADLQDQSVYLDLLDTKGLYEHEVHDYAASVRTFIDLIGRLESRGDAERLFSTHQARSDVYVSLATECTKSSSSSKASCVRWLERAETDATTVKAMGLQLGWAFFATLMQTKLDLLRVQRKNLDVAIDIERLQTSGPDSTTRGIGGRQAEVNDELERLGKEVAATAGNNDPTLAQLEAEVRRKATADLDSFAKALDQLLDKLGTTSVTERIPFLSPRTPKEVIPVPVITAEDRNLLLSLSGLTLWLRNHPNRAVRDAYVSAASAAGRQDHQAALGAYISVLDLLEADRFSIGDARARSLFMEDKVVFYDRLARNLLADGRYGEAFQLLERVRARTFGETLAARAPEVRDATERQLLAEVLRLESEIEALQQATIDAKPSASHTQAWARLVAARDRARDEMRTRAPRLSALYRPPPVGFERLQAIAREDGRDILQFLVTDTSVVIWHVGPTSTKAVAVLLGRERLRAKIAELLASTRDRSQTFQATLARELYLFLLQPIRDQLRSTRLTILAQDELGGFPFQLLQDPASDRSVGETFEISYVPSASVLAQLQRLAPLTDARILSVVSSDLRARQTVDVRGPGRANVTMLRDPSKQDLFTALRGYDAVHFVGHGSFPDDQPMLATLALRPDAPITAAEVFALPLTGTKLVTLVACELGRTQIVATNEMHGMVRAFLYAGAQAVIAASWRVDDAAATLYSDTFYREVQTVSPAEAAQRALIAVKRRYPHPFDWAPYVYIGR